MRRYEGMRYVSHDGREFDFDANGVLPRPDAVRDWALEHEVMNGAVSSHTPSERTIDIPVGFRADAASAIDELASICAADVAAGAPGRLYDGDWWTECFLEGVSSRLWTRRDGRWVERTLTFYSADPSWVMERAFAVPPAVFHGGLGYNHGYPHTYGSSASVGSAVVEAAAACDVRIEVPGPADSPSVMVGGNAYSADVSVPTGGLLVIDTRKKSATLRMPDGMEIDALQTTPDAPPGSGEYAFERLSPGAHSASCASPQGAAVIVYESRMERPWS